MRRAEVLRLGLDEIAHLLTGKLIYRKKNQKRINKKGKRKPRNYYISETKRRKKYFENKGLFGNDECN